MRKVENKIGLWRVFFRKQNYNRNSCTKLNRFCDICHRSGISIDPADHMYFCYWCTRAAVQNCCNFAIPWPLTMFVGKTKLFFTQRANGGV